MVALDQSGAIERVAPFDARGVLGMQKHVHPSQRPCRAVHFLAVKGEVLGPDLFGRPDQQRTGTARRIANGVAGLRRRSFASRRETAAGV